jgi:hypothetical protein
MNDRFALRQHLKSILSLTEGIDTASLLVISIELDIDTAKELVDNITSYFVKNILILIKPKNQIEFMSKNLELVVHGKECIYLNYRFFVCGDFRISNYHLYRVIKKVIGEKEYCDVTFEKMDKNEIITELLPIHFGITDQRAINIIPPEIYNDLICNDFEVLIDCPLGNNKYQNNNLFTGK